LREEEREILKFAVKTQLMGEVFFSEQRKILDWRSKVAKHSIFVGMQRIFGIRAPKADKSTTVYKMNNDVEDTVT
jgi:hypothetical protein